MTKDCKIRWQKKVRASGGDCTQANGLVITYTTPEQYLIKGDSDEWTFVSELTKSNLKMASDEHYTPFQLLDLATAGNAVAGALFIEYTEAVKGSHFLQYSPHLKDYLGMTETTDEEILKEDEAQSDAVFMTIPRQLWSILDQHNSIGKLDAMIGIAGNAREVWEYLIFLLTDFDDTPIIANELINHCQREIKQPW